MNNTAGLTKQVNDTASLQQQINDINYKLDRLLDYMHEQKLKSAAIDDLVSDISLIGKDVYDTAVTELETSQVRIDPDEVKLLMVKLVKNVPTFLKLMETLESVTDFLKDATPLFYEVIIDFTKKLNEFDRKGYFEFARESGKVIDKVITSYGPEDIRHLSDNVVAILDTVKNLTQPDMLKAINNALVVFDSMELEKLPEYSLWRVMKELNSPEMKRGMAFIVTFLKNLSNK
jgi:uncharacterized protein YjgD (DUF1641 family)